MDSKKKKAETIYMIAFALFISSLVVSNMIFQKFFYWHPIKDASVFGIPIFNLSVGIIPYPLTFLITDYISEFYGRKKANQMVFGGLIASLFSIFIILLGNSLDAIESSPIDNATFSRVFAASPLAVLASLVAYLLAQFIDIHIYHFWKDLTKNKHLWLRNNFSTITSQIVDSLSVTSLLCVFEILPWSLFWGIVVSGIIFKFIFALLDTPVLYLMVYLTRKHFKLTIQQDFNSL